MKFEDIEKMINSVFNSDDSNNFFEIVNEPEFSLSQLKHFENIYNMNTLRFYEFYKLGFYKESQDFFKWAHNYEIFLEAEGDIKLLVEDNLENERFNNNRGGDKLSPPFS